MMMLSFAPSDIAYPRHGEQDNRVFWSRLESDSTCVRCESRGHEKGSAALWHSYYSSPCRTLVISRSCGLLAPAPQKRYL